MSYILQYICLATVQNFKLPLRDMLEFNNYSNTRETVRCIFLLIVEGWIAVVITRLLCRRLLPEGFSMKNRLLPLIAYAGLYGAYLTAVILGQHNLMKPIERFYVVSKVVDPIAALGSGMAAMVSVNEELSTVRWMMIWAVGVCSAVFFLERESWCLYLFLQRPRSSRTGGRQLAFAQFIYRTGAIPIGAKMDYFRALGGTLPR